MSNIKIVEVTNNKKGMKDFINVQYAVYKNDENWVPPLRLERKMFFGKKNPFYEHAEVAFFVAYRDENPVGRVTAHIDHNYNERYDTIQGFFGFFECEERTETAELLMDTAEKWVKEKKCDSIIGPMNFSTNNEVGFLQDGFDRPPVIMMTYTKKYYLEIFENMSYKMEKVLNAYWFGDVQKTPEIITGYAEKLKKKYGEKITMRNIDLKNLKSEIDIVLDIFNEAWSDNWGFVPMTEGEIKNMADELKMVADSKLTFIMYKDDEPVAFLIGLPDLYEVLGKIKDGRILPVGVFKLLFGRKNIKTVRVLLMGVRKKYRKLGLDFLMYQSVFEDGYEEGYRNVEMSWILDDNKNMNSTLQKIGADLYKKYVIYKKEIN